MAARARRTGTGGVARVCLARRARGLALALGALLVALVATPARAQDAGDFGRRAAALRQGERWEELAALAEERLAQAADDRLARAHLALAHAGRLEMDECVAALRALDAAGADPGRPLAGFGAPLEAVVNATYMHCWSNFDPAHNRRCWAALFDAFEQSPLAEVPASRLLMAALKLADGEQVARLEAWFERRLADAVPGGTGEQRLLARQAQGYLRAGVGGPRVLALARRSFELKWAAAARSHGYEGPAPEGPDAEGADDLEKRELCDLDCDHEYDDLALATFLSGASSPDESPLLAREPAPGAVFEDATAELGLAGVRAGRVAAGDFDGDGDPDLCFGGALWRNDREDGFVDVSQELGATARGSAALFGDYDDDGDLDLLVAAAPHPRLLRNEGSGEGSRFTDVTKEAGLEALTVEAGPEGAAWLDYDGDGRLDFCLAVYEQPMSTGHPDLLARNRGDGTFEDATAASGLGAAPAMCGRGLAPADFDADGDVDLYVSNYRLNRNFLFRNEGGELTDVAEALHLEGERRPADGRYYGHTIGSCWGDVDGDGDLDLFTANLAHPRFVSQGFSNLSMLYLSSGAEGGYTFTEERRARGIRFQETHSDPALVDYDNDGDLDLSITCVYEGVPSALWQNDGTGHFAPVTFGSGAVAFHGWGQSWLDLEGDGDLDLVVASSGGARVLRNRGNANHWLQVRFEGRKRNRFGVGARVEVETIADAPRSYVRELAAARGTSSQDSEVLHFGLGAHAGRVRLRAEWPGTGRTIEKTVRVDRVIVLR